MFRALRIAAIGSYAVLWIGGVVSYTVLNGPPADAGWTAPAFLMIAAAVILLHSGVRDAYTFAVCGIVGFASELLGVVSGIPFGSYEYTDTLAPDLFGVPIAITFAWIVVFAFARAVVGRVSENRWLSAAAIAACMTAFDLIIDPLAAGPLGYWVWEANGTYFGVPFTNFIGWFVVSYAIAAIAPYPTASDRAALGVGGSVLMFFVVVALANLLVLPAGVGIALLGLSLWRARGRLRR